MSPAHYFHDENALLERLSRGLRRRDQRVVFLVGSPLSAPCAPGMPGVPSVDGVIELIQREFEDDAAQLAKFTEALDRAGSNRYQAAFVFLQGRRGQQTANDIVRTAVLGAWTSPHPAITGIGQANIDEVCRAMDFDIRGWAINPGTEALGGLIAAYPQRFGKSILTTNFDPLLEVSIRRAGGYYFRTTLHADGNLLQTEGPGCHVIHLHGYWYGSDTLHTSRQLSQPRPRLRASLSALLRDKLVVVCAYGGWDDAFTEALMEVVQDDTSYPEIIWTFSAGNPIISDALSQRLGPGIDRGRVTLYAGIDGNALFPALLDTWSRLEASTSVAITIRSNPVQVSPALAEQVLARPAPPTVIEGDDEDRPPVIDVYVGREEELRTIGDSTARVVFITGIGGQGKSTLAAKYYSDCQTLASRFSYFVWRDCKEEAERFENQLASVIERLSEGRITGKDLAQQTAESIIGILINLITDVEVLFMFDNVDHYVEVEARRMKGSADVFVGALLRSHSKSRVIFTCRPSIAYGVPDALSVRLEGIQLKAAECLFAERGAASTATEIEAAHKLTEGHTFWLDLLAIQAAQRHPGRDLSSLLSEIRAGGGPIPARTLNSIWSTLRDREKAVLRAMAETVRPETEAEIAEYLSEYFNFNKVVKALRGLRLLNLIVIKRRPRGADLLELHPLVRHFIRSGFRGTERASYIDAIIRVYERFIGKYKYALTKRPSLSLLQHWTQSAELDVAAGRIEDAFVALHEVSHAFATSAYPRELARATRLVLSSIDWASEHEKFRPFEAVFKSHIEILSYLGEVEEADKLLDQYEHTVPDRDARYINYCEMRCFTNWVRNDFVAAVEWGKIGHDLMKSSGVDSRFTNTIAYTLALAERDAGQPESALPVFLAGRQLSEVVAPQELEEGRGEHHYGNIGRCLHFMGQIEPALVCYQKSALIIERNPVTEHVINQGYIRTWIGELLMGREEFRLAHAFLHAAARRWQQVAPPKAAAVAALLRQIESRVSGPLKIKDVEAEDLCRDWILGRNADPDLRAS